MLVDRLKSICEKRATTFAQVERAVGLGNGVISGWKTHSPQVNKLKAVTDFLGVSLDEVMRDERESNNAENENRR